MLKPLLTALAIVITANALAASKAATEAWVMNYVSNQVAAVKSTLKESYENGVRTLSVSENGTNVVVKIENPTVNALILKECADSLILGGITNGITFAYTDNGIYKSGANTIKATSTNLVLNSTYQSREVNGRCYFINDDEQVARVYWTLIQPSVAQKLIEE